MRKIVAVLLVVALVMSSLLFATAALAAGATVTYTVGECGETTITATGSGTVTNMYLVVDTENTPVQSEVIPIGSDVSLTVGPFFENTTVYWHVFGGGERDYDQPLWNGYGTPSFSQDINDYYNQVGSFSWVVSDYGDPNPFVTWYSIAASGCPNTKDMCKDDGWMDYADLGFKNQGQCIKYVNEQMHAG